MHLLLLPVQCCTLLLATHERLVKAQLLKVWNTRLQHTPCELQGGAAWPVAPTQMSPDGKPSGSRV